MILSLGGYHFELQRGFLLEGYVTLKFIDDAIIFFAKFNNNRKFRRPSLLRELLTLRFYHMNNLSIEICNFICHQYDS